MGKEVAGSISAGSLTTLTPERVERCGVLLVLKPLAFAIVSLVPGTTLPQEGVYHRAQAGATSGQLPSTLHALFEGAGEADHIGGGFQHPTVIVNQLVSSEVTWPEVGVKLSMNATLLPPRGNRPLGGSPGGDSNGLSQLHATARLEVRRLRPRVGSRGERTAAASPHPEIDGVRCRMTSPPGQPRVTSRCRGSASAGALAQRRCSGGG